MKGLYIVEFQIKILLLLEKGFNFVINYTS